MMAVFASFRFVFASFQFRFASDFYVSHQCETSEKSTFFRIEAKKVSLPFRFISLRSENDGAH
jgi:GT2 family glycosyltransferase